MKTNRRETYVLRTRLWCGVIIHSWLAAIPFRTSIAQESNVTWKNVRLDIIPSPRQCLASGREFAVSHDDRIAVVMGRDTPVVRTAAETILRFLRRNDVHGAELSRDTLWPDAGLTILLGGPDANPLSTLAAKEHADLRAVSKPGPQGYFIRTFERSETPRRIVAAIFGADDAGTLYGTFTFLKALQSKPEGISLRELQVTDEPALQVRGLSPQWAWYIGERAPYGAALWGLEQWKRAIDFMTEYRFNMLALCTYGKFPFPLERYRSRCAVDLPFDLWNPAQGLHTIRWTHPAFTDDFLGGLVDHAHARGIRVLIYSCLNLQDEIGSHQWTNKEEIEAHCGIQQYLLKRYGIDGFIFESGEFQVAHPDDLKQFGNDEWTRLKADVFLTRRYTDAIRAVKPDAIIGLVDHYLFKNWDERRVPQRVGLERWKAELPPENIVAYVHAEDTYEVFPTDRIWTYVFGPKGGLKPVIQLHLSDSCDTPRKKKAAGAYFVTYDWSPYEPAYLCFAESAWGNYGGSDAEAFSIHSSEGGVGGEIGGELWNNIKNEYYGTGAEFGEGLLTAAKGTFKGMWDVPPVLRRKVSGELVPLLDRGDFAGAGKVLAEVEAQRAFTEKGLALMAACRDKASSRMISEYPIREHLDKAILLAKVQQAWTRFVGKCCATAISLAKDPNDDLHSERAIAEIRAESGIVHESIRDSLCKAYFSYPHDKLGKFEFLTNPDSLIEDMSRLRIRFSLAVDANGQRLRLHNVAKTAKVTADSTYPSRYGPGDYEPTFAIDGKEGTPSKGIWVSAETNVTHFLQLRLDHPRRVRGIVVDWAYDAAQDWTPQDFSIQIAADEQWGTVLDVKENKDHVAVAKLDPPVPVDRIQVLITRGPRSRPRLAAINEVQVLVVEE